MGIFSSFFGSGNTPVSQQEANQQMLKMLQDRLAVSTCPTERQQLQNNINSLQRSMTPQQPPPQPQSPAPAQPQPPRPELQWLEQEVLKIKDSVRRMEEIVKTLRTS